MNDLKEIGGFIVSADPFVQHDNSLSGNGTVNSPLGVVPGYNETVLWSGASTTTAQIVLSQPFSSFDKVDVHWRSYGRRFVTTLDGQSQFAVGAVYCDQNNPQITTLLYDGAPNGTNMSWVKGYHQSVTATANAATNPNSNIYIEKVIGINRKQ